MLSKRFNAVSSSTPAALCLWKPVVLRDPTAPGLALSWHLSGLQSSLACHLVASLGNVLRFLGCAVGLET